MMKKLRCKRGSWGLIPLPLCIIILGAVMQANGQWGAGGSDTVEQRQQEIIANGGHINESPVHMKKI